MRSFLLLALAGITFSAVALGENQCSLRVSVVSRYGNVTPAIVRVQEKSGRVTERVHETRDVEFCDLGLLPVKVIVGVGLGCSQVVVEPLYLSLDKTYVLKVIYDAHNCSPEDLPRPPGCQVLLHVRTVKEDPVPFAAVSGLRPGKEISHTDKYGRILFSGKPGEPITGMVEAKGFGPTPFRVECQGYAPLEETVTVKNQ